jgi:hypothetical protein
LGHSCIPTAGRSLPVYYSQFQTFRCTAQTDALRQERKLGGLGDDDRAPVT